MCLPQRPPVPLPWRHCFGFSPCWPCSLYFLGVKHVRGNLPVVAIVPPVLEQVLAVGLPGLEVDGVVPGNITFANVVFVGGQECLAPPALGQPDAGLPVLEG